MNRIFLSRNFLSWKSWHEFPFEIEIESELEAAVSGVNNFNSLFIESLIDRIRT